MFLVILLSLFINGNTDSISHKGPDQTRLYSPPKSLKSSLSVNLFPAFEETSIPQNFMFLIGIILDLKMSLDQVLRI